MDTKQYPDFILMNEGNIHVLADIKDFSNLE